MKYRYAVWCMNKSYEYSNLYGILDKKDLYYVFNIIPTLRQTKPRERPEAAICVRKSSARRVLHFTPLNAASCVLHRPANRVIHRLQLYCKIFSKFFSENYPKIDFHSTNKIILFAQIMGTKSSYAGITPVTYNTGNNN
jgi:hypothetical protein